MRPASFHRFNPPFGLSARLRRDLRFTTPLVQVLAVFFLAMGGLGCLPLRYVTQAAAGQEDLNHRGISVKEIVDGHHLDKRTRDLLAHVARIKTFGERYGLRRTENYERYVWLNRPAVVWVVSACHPLAFAPRAWKFPVVGSITYTGWFDKNEAKAYGVELAKGGWDVDVRPSQAYSTLGWFDDPILSTMIADGPEALGDLADVILHETLHATFYIPSQSTLNESVASFFGDELSVKYLDEVAGADSKEKKSYLDLRARGEHRGEVMKRAYEQLAALYATKMPPQEKLALKASIINGLRAELQIRRSISNATLIQYKTYGSGKAELAQLLAACDGDFPRMLKTLERLRSIAASSAPHTDPALLLKPLLTAGCPAG